MNKALLVIENCCDCPYSKVFPAIAYDSFDMVDEDLVCTKTKGSHKTRYETVPFKAIAVSSRPWQTREDAVVPKWCPLLKENPSGSRSKRT